MGGPSGAVTVARFTLVYFPVAQPVAVADGDGTWGEGGVSRVAVSALRDSADSAIVALSHYSVCELLTVLAPSSPVTGHWLWLNGL